MASRLHALRRVIVPCLGLALVACAGDERPPSYGHSGPDASISLFTDTPRVIDAIPLREVNTSCGGTAMSLTRRSATVLLVVDRSGSMADPTTEGTPKWQALLAALNMVLPRVEAVLHDVGRMKYLKPLYRALMNRADTRDLARRCFERNMASYHPIARAVIAPMLDASA